MEDFFLTMDYWYQRNPGLLLLKEERAILSSLLSQKLGDVIVQMGGPSDCQLICDSPIQYQFYCALDVLRSYVTSNVIVTDQNSLSFLPGSIDVCVLAHLLGFIANPLHLLQQLYTSLAPDGQLFVLGFNSRSLWGIKSLMSSDKGYPWSGRFHPKSAVVSWLRRCGFRVMMQKTICFRPPLCDEQQWKKLLFMEALGQMCCPNFGGAYLILAQKYESTMTPLRSSWRSRDTRIHNGIVQGQALHIPSDRTKQ